MACGNEPSPVLIGTFDSGTIRQALTAASEDTNAEPVGPLTKLQVEINGDPRVIDLDETRGFAVQDLPTGELHFRVDIEGITGSLDVHEVLSGEVIEIGVAAAPGLLELRVRRRDAPPIEQEPLPVETAGALEIHGDHVVKHLGYGNIEGDVIITGDHVTVIGPDYYGCREGGRAVAEGDLIIEGSHVRVINLEVEGRTVIHGGHVKIYEPCRKSYDDDGERDDDDDSESDSD
jgi:hypothetical protein